MNAIPFSDAKRWPKIERMSSDYENLKNFTLFSHGDRREREWCVLIAEDFPSYERFWQGYIVPLTNRIDPKFKLGDPLWIRFRASVKDKTLEKLTMQHYSVFYHLARALLQIRSGKSEFPEDVFTPLDSCGDNALEFFESVRSVLCDLGYDAGFLPRQKTNRGTPFQEIEEYRDTLLHAPVLGRRADTGKEFLPRREHLNSLSDSWRFADSLASKEMVEAGQLFSRLQQEVTTYLEERWRQIIDAFDACQGTEKFKRRWGLDDLLPVIPPPEDKAVCLTCSPASTSATNALFIADTKKP